jgi:hypothetical protein
VVRAWIDELRRAQRTRAASVLRLSRAVARLVRRYDPLEPRRTYRAVKRVRKAAKRAGVPKAVWKRPLKELARGTLARPAMLETVRSLCTALREHLSSA